MIRTELMNTSNYTVFKTAYAASHKLRMRAFSDYELTVFYLKTGIIFQENMTGKMEGMHSISTSAALNPVCRARAMDPESVCAACYALALLNERDGLAAILEQNFEVLTTEIIPVEQWPVVHGYWRVESFGDLANTIQAHNYINFILRNKDTACFGWWTKNPAFIDMAMRSAGVTKDNLSNCQFVLSCDRLNAADNYCTRTMARFPWIDRVFIVYTADYALENGIAINCGEKKCIECRACYTANGPRVIREMIKQQARKYYQRKFGLYATQNDVAAAIKAAMNVTKKSVTAAIKEARDNDYIFAEIVKDNVRAVIGIEKYGYSLAYGPAVE